MDLRSDLHEALDVVTPPAPHLPQVVIDALREDVRPRRSARRLLVPAAALAVLLGVVVTVVVVLPSMVPAGPATSPATGSAPAPSGDLAVTRWVQDPAVVAGPYPGYRPELAPIDRSMVTSAHATADPAGSGRWVVDGTLDARGRQAFAELTTAAWDACPSHDCPEAHMTFWAGLTQDDVDHWSDRAALYKPVAAGGKLLADPLVTGPITGGEFLITGTSVQGGFSQAQARAVARWLNARG